MFRFKGNEKESPSSSPSPLEYVIEHPDQVQQALEIHAQTTENVAKVGGVKGMAGVAAAGAGIGLLTLGGPTGLVMGGIGNVYLATKSSPAGEVARASGELAITAKEKASAVNKKYNVTGKTKMALRAGQAKYQELDQKYQVRGLTDRRSITAD